MDIVSDLDEGGTGEGVDWFFLFECLGIYLEKLGLFHVRLLPYYFYFDRVRSSLDLSRF